MRHTKGPWKIQKLEENHHGYENWKTFAVRSPANVCLAIIGDVDRYHEKDHEANARLIASAPEMYEALKEIDEWWAGGDCPVELQDKMRAAIKKAEGE